MHKCTFCQYMCLINLKSFFFKKKLLQAVMPAAAYWMRPCCLWIVVTEESNRLVIDYTSHHLWPMSMWTKPGGYENATISREHHIFSLVVQRRNRLSCFNCESILIFTWKYKWTVFREVDKQASMPPLYNFVHLTQRYEMHSQMYWSQTSLEERTFLNDCRT